jgi:L,D-peptidoglycan transpeptidase YkuD (ErfK/YbiS/YcfS/YnhG family)
MRVQAADATYGGRVSRRRVASLVIVGALALATGSAPAAAARATPAPAVRATAVAPPFAPPVPGASRLARSIPAGVTQVIVVSAPSWRSTAGTLTAWQRTTGGWRRVALTHARLGSGGLVLARNRHQDSGTTPAGLFAITEAFGRYGDPGTAMPYRTVTDDDWWVEDRSSRYYNQMRRGSLGGFAVRARGYNASEHLARMGHQYDYAAVIDFNRPRPVVGRGAGIFLHAYGDVTTVGCVSVPRATMRALLRWMDPAAHPRIAIGPVGWLGAPAP